MKGLRPPATEGNLHSSRCVSVFAEEIRWFAKTELPLCWCSGHARVRLLAEKISKWFWDVLGIRVVEFDASSPDGTDATHIHFSHCGSMANALTIAVHLSK